jgi:hypothetical protein
VQGLADDATNRELKVEMMKEIFMANVSLQRRGNDGRKPK